MRNSVFSLKFLVLFATVLWLSACGIDRGGIDQPLEPLTVAVGGVVAGKIDRIDLATNTLTINDQGLDVSATGIVINGIAANVGDLAVGMYASTVARPGTQLLTPTEVRVDFNAAGGAVDFDPAVTVFDLFGQTVSTNNLQANLAGPQLPAPGVQTVLVSGYVTSMDIIDATLIASYDANSPFIVTGFTRNVDAVIATFEIGAQDYNYSEAVNISTSDGMVDEFTRVRVQLAPGSANGALNVLTIEDAPLIDAGVATNATINLSGYITSIADASNFSVSFINAMVDDTTTYTNLIPAGLTVDRLINIEGTLLQDRTVLIRTVTLLD